MVVFGAGASYDSFFEHPPPGPGQGEQELWSQARPPLGVQTLREWARADPDAMRAALQRAAQELSAELELPQLAEIVAEIAAAREEISALRGSVRPDWDQMDPPRIA